MLDIISQELKQKSYIHEISNKKWLMYSQAYINEPAETKRTAFLKALANHSGVPNTQIQIAFNAFAAPEISSAERSKLLAELQEIQIATTSRITEFQQKHSFFKTQDLQRLFINRAQWNAFIAKFTHSDRQKLTSRFFFSSLSGIQRVSNEKLVNMLREPQPERRVKKRKYSTFQSTNRSIRRSYVEDDGVNPLIFESTNEESELTKKLEESGARKVLKLTPATPEKTYPGVILKKTPGGEKVRPIYDMNTGDRTYTLFKHLTPNSKRADVSTVNREQLIKKLPKLLLGRAKPLEYIATRDTIIERIGKARTQSGRSKMGASGADIFRAHGIKIEPWESYSIHLAHLIAHFAADEEDIIIIDPEPEEELVNLVPSTATANYNTLEAIELFLRKKLIDNQTNEIYIHVEPQYIGEALIPSLLIYTLCWTEENQQKFKEIHYINPLSYFRITKLMHQSMTHVRDERKIMLPVESEEMEYSESCSMCP